MERIRGSTKRHGITVRGRPIIALPIVNAGPQVVHGTAVPDPGGGESPQVDIPVSLIVTNVKVLTSDGDAVVDVIKRANNVYVALVLNNLQIRVQGETEGRLAIQDGTRCNRNRL